MLSNGSQYKDLEWHLFEGNTLEQYCKKMQYMELKSKPLLALTVLQYIT